MRGITPYTTTQGPKRFLAYDLEWLPPTFPGQGSYSNGIQVRCAGVYDGNRYRAYHGPGAMQRFLDGELTHRTRGCVYFAHAGGLADVQFVLESIVRRGPDTPFEVSASLAGSSAIIVKVKRGNNVWTFCDSFWLFRTSLRKIGESMGLYKGGGEDFRCPGVDDRKIRIPRIRDGKRVGTKDVLSCGHEPGTCMFYAPMPLLLEYNQRDCEILWKAIARFENEVLELGGELKHTIASTALRLFRARFLKSTIHTVKSINEDAREAYTASRVEVFAPRSNGPGFSWDINSSFPHSMLAPAPGNLTRVNRTLPDSGGLYVAQATVNVPHGTSVPPLPYRHDGRVYFPTGTWGGWFTSVDLDYLQEKGGTVLGVSKVYHFEPFTDLADYVSVIYELRRVENDPFRKLVYKYLLNSLYGKFAERSEKERILIRPQCTAGLRTIAPGIFAETQDIPVSHTHVPIAAHITALSRRLLGRYIDQARELGRVFYCDTDSVFTDAVMPTSDALGGLKKEKEYTDAVFVAPKLYRCDESVRAKGFPSLKRAEFDRMVDEVWTDTPFDDRTPKSVRRMMRIKELWGRGYISPRELDLDKRLALYDRPKRCPVGDSSRPWTVREIQEPWEHGGKHGKRKDNR